jgi:hypothetical protein
MKKFVLVFAGIALGLVVGLAISTYAADDCFPVGAGACVKIALPAGTDPPAQCSVGEIYVDLVTATDVNCTTSHDNSLCICDAPNTWVQLDNN